MDPFNDVPSLLDIDDPFSLDEFLHSEGDGQVAGATTADELLAAAEGWSPVSLDPPTSSMVTAITATPPMGAGAGSTVLQTAGQLQQQAVTPSNVSTSSALPKNTLLAPQIASTGSPQIQQVIPQSISKSMVQSSTIHQQPIQAVQYANSVASTQQPMQIMSAVKPQQSQPVQLVSGQQAAGSVVPNVINFNPLRPITMQPAVQSYQNLVIKTADGKHVVVQQPVNPVQQQPLQIQPQTSMAPAGQKPLAPSNFSFVQQGQQIVIQRPPAVNQQNMLQLMPQNIQIQGSRPQQQPQLMFAPQHTSQPQPIVMAQQPGAANQIITQNNSTQQLQPQIMGLNLVNSAQSVNINIVSADANQPQTLNSLPAGQVGGQTINLQGITNIAGQNNLQAQGQPQVAGSTGQQLILSGQTITLSNGQTLPVIQTVQNQQQQHLNLVGQAQTAVSQSVGKQVPQPVMQPRIVQQPNIVPPRLANPPDAVKKEPLSIKQEPITIKQEQVKQEPVTLPVSQLTETQAPAQVATPPRPILQPVIPQRPIHPAKALPQTISIKNAQGQIIQIPITNRLTTPRANLPVPCPIIRPNSSVASPQLPQQVNPNSASSNVGQPQGIQGAANMPQGIPNTNQIIPTAPSIQANVRLQGVVGNTSIPNSGQLQSTAPSVVRPQISQYQRLNVQSNTSVSSQVTVASVASSIRQGSPAPFQATGSTTIVPTIISAAQTAVTSVQGLQTGNTSEVSSTATTIATGQAPQAIVPGSASAVAMTMTPQNQQLMRRIQQQISTLRSKPDKKPEEERLLNQLTEVFQRILIRAQQALQKQLPTAALAQTGLALPQQATQASTITPQGGIQDNVNPISTAVTQPSSSLASSVQMSNANVVATVAAPLLSQVVAGNQKIKQIIPVPPALQERLSKMTPDQQKNFLKINGPNLLAKLQQMQKQNPGQPASTDLQSGVQPVTASGKIPLTVQQLNNTTQPGQANVNSTKTVNSSQAGIKPTVQVQQSGILKQPITKSTIISAQLGKDQLAALTPNVNTPFKNWQDACRRLVRYHVFQTYEASEYEFLEDELIYEEIASDLLVKQNQMVNKYHMLLLQDSQRDRPTSEMVMLERLFIESEKKILADDRKLAKEDPDKFEPKPMPESSPTIKEEEKSFASDLKDEKSEEFIKSEKLSNDLHEDKDYLLSKTDGLKMVFKTSPKPEINYDEPKGFSKPEKTPQSTRRSKRLSGASGGFMELPLPKRKCKRRSLTEDLTPIEDEGVDGDLEDNCTSEIPFQDYEGDDDPHKDSEFQDDNRNISEIDSAVAGLLSSNLWTSNSRTSRKAKESSSNLTFHSQSCSSALDRSFSDDMDKAYGDPESSNAVDALLSDFNGESLDEYDHQMTTLKGNEMESAISSLLEMQDEENGTDSMHGYDDGYTQSSELESQDEDDLAVQSILG